MKADSFKIFLNKILAFPLWVKQIIYFRLKLDLEKVFLNQPLVINPNELFQEYHPKITFVGKQELKEHNRMHDEVMYTFLKALIDEKSVIDIALDSFMTLEEVSKLFTEALRNEYIMPPDSKIILGTAEFFAGQIKTGEYLMRIGRLTVDQLDMAIRRQKQLEEAGQKIYMAEIISSLGFIKNDEIVSVLMMKEEAKKRFIFNMEINATENADGDNIELKKQIQRLAYENNYLKTKLKAILKMEK